MTPTDKLQAVYDMEINAKISWFWDGGVHVSLGDKLNGIKATRHFQNIKQATNWLYDEAIKTHNYHLKKTQTERVVKL